MEAVSFFLNVGILPHQYTVSQPRIPWLECTLHCKERYVLLNSYNSDYLPCTEQVINAVSLYCSTCYNVFRRECHGAAILRNVGKSKGK